MFELPGLFVFAGGVPEIEQSKRDPSSRTALLWMTAKCGSEPH
jgi:hypothetical protein